MHIVMARLNYRRLLDLYYNDVKDKKETPVSRQSYSFIIQTLNIVDGTH